MGYATRKKWLAEYTANEYRELKVISKHEPISLFDRLDVIAVSLGVDVENLRWQPDPPMESPAAMLANLRAAAAAINAQRRAQNANG